MGHGSRPFYTDFVMLRNENTGHYGMIRIDDITRGWARQFYPQYQPTATLNATWWCQTDGTKSFSTVPEPNSLAPLLTSVGVICACRYKWAEQ